VAKLALVVVLPTPPLPDVTTMILVMVCAATVAEKEVKESKDR
jgi:hypothetical protein